MFENYFKTCLLTNKPNKAKNYKIQQIKNVKQKNLFSKVYKTKIP